MARRNKRFARLLAGAGLTIASLVVIAEPAFAGTITLAGCEAGGGTVVDHGAWQGCRGIAPYDIKIVG